MNSYQLKNWKQRGQHNFLPQTRGRCLLLPCWQVKLSSSKLRNEKKILSAISQEMEARQVPNKSPSKPENTSLAQAHGVSSNLHSSIKEGALKINILKLSALAERWLKERHPLNSGLMTYRPSGRHSVSALREGIHRSLKGTQSAIWALLPPWTPS